MPVGALAVLGGGTEKSSGSAVGCAGVREGVLGVPKTPPPRGPPLCVPATVSALQPRWLRSSELTPPAPLPMFSEPPGSPPAPPALSPIPRPRCGPAAARCANGESGAGLPLCASTAPSTASPRPARPPPPPLPGPGWSPEPPRSRAAAWSRGSTTSPVRRSSAPSAASSASSMAALVRGGGGTARGGHRRG